MSTDDMSQREAAARAWLAAEMASECMNVEQTTRASAWADVARAWAAVAGQLEFVTVAEYVPDDPPTERLTFGVEDDQRPYPAAPS